MSLFGALNTAVSGLTAQSTAFGNISEDVSNSQTVGFKRVDTSFTDYLTTSTPTDNVPGAVVARPVYVNNIQGTITQTDNPLGMAVAGQGFFAVSQPIGTAPGGATTFNPQQFYTRAGDFTMNAGGFLVNSAGQFLNGWAVNPSTKITDQNALVPIQVSQQTFNPVATAKVSLAANLPATPTLGTAAASYTNANGSVTPSAPLSSQITVYDSLGTAHTVTMNWVQTPNPASTSVPPAVLPNQWTVQIQVPDAKGTLSDGTPAYADAGSATVKFGDPNLADPDPTVPQSGTIAQLIGNGAPNTFTDVVNPAAASTATSPSTTIAVVPPTGSPVTSYTVTQDDGKGGPLSLTSTTTNILTGGVAGSAGVPLVSAPVLIASPGNGANATVMTKEPDGSVTFVQTDDSTTGHIAGPPPQATVTTTTIPPRSGATTVIPTGTGTGSYDPNVTAQNQDSATLQFHTDFGSGDQLISLNLGTYGGTNGVTQYAGTAYSLLGLTQDGVPPGSFSGVSTQADGNVVVNYNNGQTKTIAQIPLVTFNAPNGLQSQNGQSFTATPASGSPLAEAAGTNGAGTLVVGSVEGSNVDIATQFTTLIVTQQAYGADTKVVTTANAMLQATLQMIA